MGQFEKIVVLLAFFLVTLILVVTFSGEGEEGLSLHMGQDELAEVETTPGTPDSAGDSLLARDNQGQGSNPRSRNDARGGPAQADPVVPNVAPKESAETPNLATRSLQERSLQDEADRREQESRGDLFLDDSFSVRPTAPAALPEGSALVTVEGLRRTWDESIMEYDWQRNDDWVSLARRLYNDHSMSELLRQFNEGSTYVAPGTPVLIPVFDRRDKSAKREAETVKLDAPREELSEERGTLYKVVDGDSLWVISKKVYGKGHLWEKIYNANTDLLKSPESVKPGMGLRIP